MKQRDIGKTQKTKMEDDSIHWDAGKPIERCKDQLYIEKHREADVRK